MPSKSRRRFNRTYLVPILALFAVIILALGISPRPTTPKPADAVSRITHENAPFSDLVSALQPQSVTFGPNIRANQDATQFGQHEPHLAVSRVNTNTVIIASKDYRDANVKHVWIDGSTDGGVTWPVQLQVPGIPAPLNIQSDPVVVARDDGRIYVAVLATNNAQSSGGIFLTWTDDNGTTWQNPSIPVWYPKNGLDDKEWLAIDNNPSSPYYHRMYILYVPFAGSLSGRVVEQHSTDGGSTWTVRQAVGIADTEYNYPIVGSDGTVYDFMMENWGFGQTGTIRMAKSTNGGVNWTSPSVVTTAQQPNSPIRPSDSFRFYAILSAAVDPNTNHLYVAWTDNRNFNTNGTDVMYVKSTDNGATWSPSPIRLSHDPTGVVRDHHTPVLSIGADSRIHAFWMDRRNDPANHLFDEWYSSSTDGGATWEADTRVNRCDPNPCSQDLNVAFPPGSGNAAGDYWGLDTYLDTVYVAWNDTRTGEQDILVSRGMLSSGGGPTPTITPTRTATTTSTASSTLTTTSTATNTPTTGPTNTPGGPTSTLTRTSTSVPTSTSTNTSVPSFTSTGTITPVTNTPSPTNTPTPSNTTVPFCEPAWRYMPNPGPNGRLAISAVDHTSGWAIEFNAIYAWNGQSWQSQSFPAFPPGTQDYSFVDVSAASSTEAWILGIYYDASFLPRPFVLHFSNGAWAFMPGLTALTFTTRTHEGGIHVTLSHIASVGSNEAYAVGAIDSQNEPILIHCTPQGCGYETSGITTGFLNAVSGTSPADVWVVGNDTATVYEHYNGTTWQTSPGPDVPLNDITSIAPNNVWAMGVDGPAHYDGISWSHPAGITGLDHISGVAADNIWASGGSGPDRGIYHYDGTQWHHTYSPPTPPSSINDVAALPSGEAWAAAADGNILFYGTDPYYTDVVPDSTFYAYIQELTCRTIVNGYPCGSPNEPCDPANRPYFRPANNVTRGQLSKIVALSAGLPPITNTRTFEDVAVGSTFHSYIESLYAAGAINGYPCGGPGEPCVAPANRPYFRPNATSTRGQIAKIVAITASYVDPTTNQTFADVPVGSTFHLWIENLAARNIINGYPCGGPGEPCDPSNRPYFRPSNNVTRGQMSKIAINTFFP